MSKSKSRRRDKLDELRAPVRFEVGRKRRRFSIFTGHLKGTDSHAAAGIAYSQLAIFGHLNGPSARGISDISNFGLFSSDRSNIIGAVVRSKKRMPFQVTRPNDNRK